MKSTRLPRKALHAILNEHINYLESQPENELVGGSSLVLGLYEYQRIQGRETCITVNVSSCLEYRKDEDDMLLSWATGSIYNLESATEEPERREELTQKFEGAEELSLAWKIGEALSHGHGSGKELYDWMQTAGNLTQAEAAIVMQFLSKAYDNATKEVLG
jgi:hypothetical protein